ncbi:hypothetical protein HOU90_gp022 [Lactobacillus phage Lpa804]|uniref:Uncharacterized protein n=2 Tax=Harbinvirus TaxID=2732970 RepID=A0A3Q8C6H9_9CAUD|nr:hypothetical protein HOU39_gp047 [Lactobacillus phage Iacchus]YP_009818169.1 hypothetical protein HOU90_gp022 [Lactobacillus phage Lpa804]AUG84648.1 hypothetical protein Lpa804_25 [Lactobacillus phage Lpa804]AYH91941.1 hypothetical protein [Lactobacillus phage Iacchus]
MAQNKSITREQVLNALAKHNGLTTYNNQAGSHPRTPEEDRQLETLLTKRVTLAEAFDAIDILTFPYNKNTNDLTKQIEVIGVLLNKVGITEKDWTDAENKVESKRKEQQDKIMKEIESQLKGVE